MLINTTNDFCQDFALHVFFFERPFSLQKKICDIRTQDSIEMIRYSHIIFFLKVLFLYQPAIKYDYSFVNANKEM
jgi:hypothetical protein